MFKLVPYVAPGAKAECSKTKTSVEDVEPIVWSTHMMDLPSEMLDKILSYLTYDQVAKLRSVNKRMNVVCGQRLNVGFTMVELFHNQCMKEVKAMLPRRESERKAHVLARHSDILISIETRLSMLSMTFTKYIETGQCCFFPGKVLDEAFRVLRKVNENFLIMKHAMKQITYTVTKILPRPHEFLQEYRDISSMAMEYFDEKILPGIKERMKNESNQVYYYKLRPSTAGKTNQPFVLSISPRNVRSMAQTSLGPAQPPNVASSSPTITPQGHRRLLKNLRLVIRRYATINNKLVVFVNKKTKTMSSLVKKQTTLMRKRIKKQTEIIQKLQTELKEMKREFSLVRKDTSLLKLGLCKEMQKLDRPDGGSDQGAGSNRANLSVSVASSVTIPAENTDCASCKDKGLKRSHEEQEDIELDNEDKQKRTKN